MTTSTETTSNLADLLLTQNIPLGRPARKPISKTKIVFPVAVLLALLTVGGIYVHGLGHESTDDAQVEGHVANVAARVPGQVKKVLVQDNQPVQAGDVLIELDDRDYAVKLAAARADLKASKAALSAAEKQLSLAEANVDATLRQAKGGMAQASGSLGQSQATIDQAKADIASANSKKELALLELQRAQKLVSDGAVSQVDYDTKKALYDQAGAAVDLAQARLGAAQAAITSSAGNIETAHGKLLAAQTGPAQVEAARAQVELTQAKVEQAQAALDQAELNESYTQVRAQVPGVVSRRSVEVGQMVSPERPLMAIVPLNDVWVVANFKEDQLKDMQPGQPAKIEVDTFGGQELRGHIESLSAGTGSRFSLLPPDNASGNFTKVVQRVPVLIRLDSTPSITLRPGMSANVSVDTGHH